MEEKNKDLFLSEYQKITNRLVSKLAKTGAKRLTVELSKNNGDVVVTNFFTNFELDDEQFQFGRKEHDFLEACKSFLQDEQASSFFTVACMVQAFPNRKDESFDCKFFFVSEENRTFKDDGIVFDSKYFKLTQEEFDLCCQTKLAFYDEQNEVLYPILTCAIPALGRYMDAANAFKGLSEHPIGNGMTLADKISRDHKDFKFLAIKKEQVRPIISVGVEKTLCGDYTSFFEEFFSVASTYGYYQVIDWKIGYKETDVTIRLQDEIGTYVTFHTSNLVGEGFSISAWIKLRDGYMISLSEKTGYRTKSYNLSETFSFVLARAKEIFLIYQRKIAAKNARFCQISELLNKRLAFALGGKAKVEKLKAQGKLTLFGSNEDMLNELVRDTYKEVKDLLHKKKLMEVYVDFIKELPEEREE